MTYLILEVLIFLLIAFAIGFAAAWFLRGFLLSKETAEARPTAAPTPAPPAPASPAPASPAPATTAQPETAAPELETAALASAEVAEPGKPLGLAEAEGKPDDLQAISGVGPKIEGILHELGIFHFHQIAAWTPENVDWVDGYLKFHGRIGREDWIGQAKILAEGGETEFSKGRGRG